MTVQNNKSYKEILPMIYPWNRVKNFSKTCFKA
jgi:hypothetical protein